MKQRQRYSAFLFLAAFLLSATVAADSPTIKVATYNIAFLDADISSQRKANLQKVLEDLDADIIGFQEIDDHAALENILSEDYQIVMIDDPRERQELALAARKPFQIISQGMIFPDTTYDSQFPGSRDLLEVRLGGYGYELVVLVYHAKSRWGGREKTDFRREGAAEMIVNYIRSQLSGKSVMMLGDFNDNPDDRSLNILEFGDPGARGGIDDHEDTFLYNATEPLLEKDYCSFGYHYFYANRTTGSTFDPAVTGSRQENNKWRDIPHDYVQDVKIKEVLLDQILLSLNLKDFVRKVGVFNEIIAIQGKPSRIRFAEGELLHIYRGDLPSDHVPVWVTLELPEREEGSAQ